MQSWEQAQAIKVAGETLKGTSFTFTEVEYGDREEACGVCYRDKF